MVSNLQNPLASLQQGHWFKLICGASFQHLPAVRNLALAYTLAGADCIDVAADRAVIAAVKEGLQAAKYLAPEAEKRGFLTRDHKSEFTPWLMVSFNDGEDIHFRKATFNPTVCPQECWRPCEKICPTKAIVFSPEKTAFSGVKEEICYGCGRCLPICPIQNIITNSFTTATEAIAPLIITSGIDAIEIHTQVGHLTEFQQLWQNISPVIDQLKIIAISCPDHEQIINYLQQIYNIISPSQKTIIWQTDGRPMSGDIGDGTTHATIKLSQKVLAAKLPGYVQLAGGTNNYTVTKLKQLGMLKTSEYISKKHKKSIQFNDHYNHPEKLYISGIAYGSYARILLAEILEKLEKNNIEKNPDNNQRNINNKYPILQLETAPELLWQAVSLAHNLVQQIKS